MDVNKGMGFNSFNAQLHIFVKDTQELIKLATTESRNLFQKKKKTPKM